MPEVPELGQSAARAREAALQGATTVPPGPESGEEDGPQAPQVIQAHVAILLIQTKEGETILTTDINAPVVVERPATRDEAYGMLATAQKDIEIQEVATHTSATTIAQIEAKQAAALRAMQDAQVQHAINQGGGIRGRG